MSAVSNVSAQVTLNASALYTLASGVLQSYQIPATIAVNGANGTLSNGNGAANLIDLAGWGQVSLASTTDAISFAALPDPGGVTQNWENGRIRLFIVQVVTPTAGFDLEVYSSASNGVTFLPPLANTLFCSAGGIIIPVLDFASNGSSAGTHNKITSSTFALTFNSGSNTVVFNWLALGSSVA